MTPPRAERWLVVVTEYAGLSGYTGGIGRHYASLLPGLVRLGIAVDLLVFADGPPVADHDLEGVQLIGFHDTSRTPRLLTMVLRAWRARKAYARARYDRVFMPEWAGVGAFLPPSAPLLTNLATSLALANRVAGYALSDFPLWSRVLITAQNLLESRQIRRSAGLIAISRAMLAETRAGFAALPPAQVVRNCIEVDAVAAAAQHPDLPEGWPAGDGAIVLFLGRLERRKGVVEAVRAFAEAAKRFPDARLVMAGASGDRRFEPDKQELLSHLTPESRQRVTWLGHVPGLELYRAISEAAVTICPSLWEGFGNVALEVKTIGAPLICTTGSGYDDFCADGEDCLMVAPGDAAGLAQAIVQVLESPVLGAELGQMATRTVARFAPDPVAADLAAAAEDILGKAPAGR